MSESKRPKPYERPELPWERKATPMLEAGRWAAAGFEFGLAVVLFFLGGRWLDAHIGTSPWMSVIGAMVGVAAGIYLLVRPLLGPRRPRD